MLRPRTFKSLQALGLGVLGDASVSFFRYAGALHAFEGCVYAEDGSLAEQVSLVLRGVLPGEVCRCVCGFFSAPTDPVRALGDASNFVEDLSPLLSSPAALQGSSPRALRSVAARLGVLEAVLARFPGGVVSPLVLAVQEELLSRLDLERETLLSRLRMQGAEAVLLEEAAMQVTWGGDVSLVIANLRSLSTAAGISLVNEWVDLVGRGFKSEARLARLAALSGALLLEEGMPRKEVGPLVASMRLVWLDLEERFAALVADPGPLSLVVPGSSPLGRDPYLRLLVEAFALRQEGGRSLLLVPPRVLSRLEAELGRPRRRSTESVLAPSDPLLLEMVVGLWDPFSGSLLASLEGALEAASLL